MADVLVRRAAEILVLTLSCACGAGPVVSGEPLVLWHTFGPEETAALNEALEAVRRSDRLAVTATVLPFGRAQNRLFWTLGQGGDDCPDLARIDATWLPGLAAAGLLAPLADEALLEGVTPEAAELARWDGRAWGVPQALDGLALIYDPRQVDAATAGGWPPADLEGLERAARAFTRPGRHGLSVRADGYWFVAWLRAAGGDVVDPATGALGVDRPEAREALRRYAALVAPGGPAPAPESAGDEAAREAQRFAAGELAVVVGGPWTVAALERAARERGVALELEVAPYPRAPDGRPAAPRGAQLYVVPRCARRPAEAWRLAARLTAGELQADWSRRLGIVPTRRAALDQASPVARGFAAALAVTRPLPRDPLTPQLFDDLTPAVQAVVAGDATADEALDGVARGWRRLLLARGPQ